MLFTVSHLIKTLAAYVPFGLSYVQNVPFSTWRKHKDGCTTTSLQYQWYMIRWSAESHTVKMCSRSSSTFLIWLLYKFLIHLLEILYTKVVIIIIIIVLVTRKLPLRVSQGTVATFYRCGGQSYNRLFSIFRIVHTENYKNRLIFDWVISRVVVLVPWYLTSCVLAITLVIGPLYINMWSFFWNTV